MSKNKIIIASALLLNANGDLLVVRKKNSSFYMLPGGKVEQGEKYIHTLIRELKEELGLDFNEDDFQFLGQHETIAANEVNTIVQGNIFKLINPLHAENLQAHAELDEVTYLTLQNYTQYKLAHLLEEFALPIWIQNASNNC